MLRATTRRHLQTVRPSVPATNATTLLHGALPSSTHASPPPDSASGWARHSLPLTPSPRRTPVNEEGPSSPPYGGLSRSAPRIGSRPLSKPLGGSLAARSTKDLGGAKAATAQAAAQPTQSTTQAAAPQKAAQPRRKLRPRKAVITLSDKAVRHLQQMLDSPNPQMIRVGVKNRGCSGLTYHLEYVETPGKFDEEVVQDGVKVLIDSKALFSIIGSEMDWIDDKLSSRFVFSNPNSKGQCGCGESFMV